MVKLFPFEGILYNKGKFKKLDNLFTPPYDVIDDKMQEDFYNLHDFNFIRLILGKEFSSDGEYNNKYIRSAAFLEGWLRHRILIKDEKPSFYIYEQRFSLEGKKFTRLGFFALLRLEDMGRGKVFPHEETYSRAKLDRLQLMRTTSSNLESIFSVYSDPKSKLLKIFKKYMRRKPLIDVTDKDKDKVKHRLWKIDKKPAITKIIKEMRDKTVFIADGHHRYEAALRFKNELKTKNTKFSEEEAYNHILMYFTPIEDKGLAVLPIHRVLYNLPYFDPNRFEKELERFFDVKLYKATKTSAKRVQKKLLKDLTKKGLDQHAYGMYLGNNKYYLLTLKDEYVVEEMVEEEKPKAWKNLDVTVLHYAVFDRILGIANETEDKVSYVKALEEAIDRVDNHDYQVAFLLNPTKLEEITSIASKLEKMPHKSTYFYPKLLSGLVINKIVHGEKIKL
ncbi:MAG: DUF1015 domain-containing protein [Candidatus Margulisiibacteriota bacterium]|nr:DUF1015 domain-containing protein [Candidatus Margulisiibacteriota bacterium]